MQWDNDDCNSNRPDKHINDRPEGNDGKDYYTTHNEQKFLVFTERQHSHIVLLRLDAYIAAAFRFMIRYPIQGKKEKISGTSGTVRYHR